MDFDFGVGRPRERARRRQEISATEVAELRRAAAARAFGVDDGSAAPSPRRRYVFSEPAGDAQDAATRQLQAVRPPARRRRVSTLTSQPALAGVTPLELPATLPPLRRVAFETLVEPLARALERLAAWLRRL